LEGEKSLRGVEGGIIPSGFRLDSLEEAKAGFVEVRRELGTVKKVVAILGAREAKAAFGGGGSWAGGGGKTSKVGVPEAEPCG
jgi:hypothetical protein